MLNRHAKKHVLYELKCFTNDFINTFGEKHGCSGYNTANSWFYIADDYPIKDYCSWKTFKSVVVYPTILPIIKNSDTPAQALQVSKRIIRKLIKKYCAIYW